MFHSPVFFFAPDAQPGSSGGAEPTPRAKRPKDLLPDGDVQLADLASFVASVWPTQPWLTLRYTTAGTFAAKAAENQTSLARRREAGGERPTDAIRIGQLDEQINEHLYRVKGMLSTKYNKKTAPAYYAKMGIVKQAKQFILPRERSKRAAALSTLVQGLTAEGFLTQTLPNGTVVFEYGTAFWQPIATEYAQLIKDLTTDTGDISDVVGEKNLLRDEIEQTLRSIIKLLDGNYPVRKEYKAQLRVWGFQKENY